MTTPVENLSQDEFALQDCVAFLGRPVGVLIIGSWQGDVCELMVGMMALEPFDFCRLIAGVRFVPGQGLSVMRTTEPDDARDDDGVIERHFEKKIGEIMAAVFMPLGEALAEAAELRAEEPDEKPVREMPAASTWVH